MTVPRDQELASSSSSTRSRSSSDDGSLNFRSFTACVSRPESAIGLRDSLQRWPDAVTVYVNDNVRGVRDARVIILGCKPRAYRVILGAPGMRDALKGKLLVSILGGVSVNEVEDALYAPHPLHSPDPHEGGRCTIIRAIPNIAALVGQSTTIIPQSQSQDPSQTTGDAVRLVTAIFKCVGHVATVSTDLVDVATSIGASSLAFFATLLEAVAAGATPAGMPLSQAIEIAAYAMLGTAELVLSGEQPSTIRLKVATPGGSTMTGLQVLQDRRVPTSITDAVEATVAAVGRLSARHEE
ncbi:hypothetical protein ASPCADRAFT_127819 [Aspergillus carbonarius ITEM 5010]|uniref:Pyrroline-5-carboxylate reductase dimerisation domain-containing protein n=1 Tax=Aspergillus carbonarius (strain ITEM 5010) TaxID=602072 RepID=A0A1R3RXR7_ASPC5|nr:hypothetical protein ASPCADRAFT_127819 [Aspergillus carbonarius ITEM 5010]